MGEEEDEGDDGGAGLLPLDASKGGKDEGPAASGQSSDNPFGDALDVTVSIPETLEIKMVDATVLSDYEVWQFISSILGAAVVGFAVARSIGRAPTTAFSPSPSYVCCSSGSH